MLQSHKIYFEKKKCKFEKGYCPAVDNINIERL